jgi:nitrate reductase molybdenum cofactor assembly chaperone NarJ/NarW
VIPPCLFAYPGNDCHALAAAVPEFAGAIEGMGTGELEELYARTFDWNPDTSLEIGWHIHGENYERGEFLVRVRQLLRRHGISESEGLPDHLTHVMPLLGRMPAEEAAGFAAEYVVPALRKIEAALSGTQNPYLHLVRAVARQMGPAAEPAPALVVLEGGSHG